MTRKKYFEKNNTSFADALKEYDADRDGCFSTWLNDERPTKFKLGDMIRGPKGGVYGVIGIDDDNYRIIEDGTYRIWTISMESESDFELVFRVADLLSKIVA